MQFDQHPAGGDDILRLGTKQPDGLDVFGQPFFTQGQHRFRRRGGREQPGGRLVDADVRRLCREDDGNQQLEGRRVVQFGCRCRICIAQAGEELLDLGLFHRTGWVIVVICGCLRHILGNKFYLTERAVSACSMLAKTTALP
jgi:hypothetical protein